MDLKYGFISVDDHVQEVPELVDRSAARKSVAIGRRASSKGTTAPNSGS